MNFITMFIFDGVAVGIIFYSIGNYVGTLATKSQALV